MQSWNETQATKSARPGRPGISDDKKQQMRKKIAASAQRLFQTEGYGHVSMRRIAKDVGCSPMTLYKYYDARIDILRTLWADVFRQVFNQLDVLDVKDFAPREKLSLLATTYVEYWLNHTEHYRLVFMADGVTQPEVSIFIDTPEIVARYQVFANAIMAGQIDLSPDTLKLKLDGLICILHGIAHNLITISGYDWSAASDLVEIATRTLIDD
jgi:AcrR family transcriptional regulator